MDSVMVQRGRKCVTRIGPSRWNRAWRVLSLSQLGYALKASTMISLTCVGEMVVEMLGLCIGRVMSSAALAVQLGEEEASVLEAPPPHCGGGTLGSHSQRSCGVGRWDVPIQEVIGGDCRNAGAVFFYAV